MNWIKLLKNREFGLVLLDLFMMWVLTINLTLIVFDWLFMSRMVQHLLQKLVPAFYYFYDANIHQDFLSVDLMFVAVFIAEILFSWALAVKRKTYHKWFFYPFVHWYDVLGCIPIGSLRFFRILRVISILLRLHKLGIIDLTQTSFYKAFGKYLNILVEEVSDRVVVNVLENLKDEVKQGHPVAEKIMQEVVNPQQEALVEWLSFRIGNVVASAHRSYQDDLQRYIDQLVAEAVEKNKEIGRIEQVPLFGGLIAGTLEKAISDIVFNVIDRIIADLASPRNKTIINDLLGLSIETVTDDENVQQLNEIAKGMLTRSIDILIDQVKIQQWKVKEMQEKEIELEARLKVALEQAGIDETP